MMHLQLARKTWPGADSAVLADIELHVAAGEFVCLVGPSGCGKSTLLALIAGLDAEFSGTLRASADLGLLFQTPRLMPWLTVRENLALVLPQGRCDAHALELLAAMGLDAATLDRYPGQLSGGQQRRVALARAFAARPRLLLLDEPFVSLDAPVAQRLRELLLAQWQAERPGVLFVTHDLDEALTLADRIVFLGGAPAQVVLEWRCGVLRPRSPAAVAGQRAVLLGAHPDLLAGRRGCGPAQESADG
ncbi:ABC transporter ATP-binding protein [Plasticicumulans acidivorans]|uniref:NitT/TauT family transport system ATP-binding protein n=1 Tax=Plasticicumulans acidivorans TaxID=886464 RepID=A0A317MTG6_9GAMM|nr:ATP-binding cassette domain-containing protein [Plasticicumulans acidivorans]PWV60633.1 NitT/TauT family transport system ATP-binding protein [Plasticicumulans acidivorans]